MDNAFGQPQTIVVLGGTSEIGLAIARKLVSPVTRTVVLACRDLDKGERAAATMRQGSLTVDVVHFDGADTASHEAFVREVTAAHGDLDVVIVAFGQLGDGEATGRDVDDATRLAQVNFTGAVSSSIAVANQLRTQGHGTLVVLSSVAGERVRKANFVYGATKAGLDGFAQGLGDSLVGSGARVLVVRPGFVHSAMTAGLPAAPFATTPEHVAEVTVKGLRAGRRTVWAPGILRYVFSALRHVPGPIWRRLPLG
ncbi:MAG: decaprenylphospho-beta-D-erythro-pentofuranosid-2-ulose 2-reductase [Ilumatobacteraceae bacterium]